MTVDGYRSKGSNIVASVDSGGRPTTVVNRGGERLCGVLEVLKRLVKVNDVDIVLAVKSNGTCMPYVTCCVQSGRLPGT